VGHASAGSINLVDTPLRSCGLSRWPVSSLTGARLDRAKVLQTAGLHKISNTALPRSATLLASQFGPAGRCRDEARVRRIDRDSPSSTRRGASTESHTYPYDHPNCHCYGDRHTHRHTYGDSDTNGNRHSNSHGDTHGNRHEDTDADSDSDSDSYSDRHGDAYGHSHGHGSAHSSADA
jgi:hypothetical protein